MAAKSRGLILNQIGTVTVTTAGLVLIGTPTTGSRAASSDRSGDGPPPAPGHCQWRENGQPQPSAEHLAQIARSASTEAEAVELVRLALEDILK